MNKRECTIQNLLKQIEYANQLSIIYLKQAIIKGDNDLRDIVGSVFNLREKREEITQKLYTEIRLNNIEKGEQDD